MAGRKKNLLESQPLTLQVTPQVLEDLEAIVVAARGRMGKNPTEVAERLLTDQLTAIAKEGMLLARPKPVRRRS